MKNNTSEGAVSFKCPNCLKGEITRTQHERKTGAKYTCEACGFSGPN